MLSVVKQEYEDIVKNEVQRAISADEDMIAKLCANYIDNIKAYTQKEKVKNPYTGQDEEPDERLMRSIEEKIDIPESRKDDFRREIMNYIGALAIEGRTFDYKTNERLHKALEAKLFEDQKDSIKLTSLVSNVVDRDTQAKIDVVKQRLIKNFGYDEVSATDVLNFVASIFARGDVKTYMSDPRGVGRSRSSSTPRWLSCWPSCASSWHRGLRRRAVARARAARDGAAHEAARRPPVLRQRARRHRRRGRLR